MELRFTSQIRKGNKKGTGFFYIPSNKVNLLNLGERIKVNLDKEIYFYSKITKHNERLGVYVPQHIAIENNLINKEVETQIEKVEGFYAKMYSDGRIYIPKDIVKKQKLNHNDIVLIKGIENGKVVYEKFSKIYVTKRKNRLAEYHCVFNKIFRNKELLFKIEKRSQEAFKENLSPILTQLLKGMHYAFVNKGSIIIFKGNKVPAILSTKINYPELAFYLGAYFADGTRKGNYWAICASTFEQAKYYLKIHKSLVKDSRPEFIISYTNIYNIDNFQLQKELAKIWGNEVGIKVDKFRIRKPSGKSISKWNKYGTLVIREPRQILLDIYNFLLKELLKEILLQKNKELAVDFFCGVLEGDGCSPTPKRGHISIASNKDDIHILESILRITSIKFKIVKEENNKYGLKIGALEILKNFDLLKDKVFILYPKRRKIFFERLKIVRTTKFLIGNHEPAAWVKTWLKNTGLCDRNYKITESGLILKGDLLKAIQKT